MTAKAHQWTPSNPAAEHPDHTVASWMEAVSAGATRSSYVDWVNARIGAIPPSQLNAAFLEAFIDEFGEVMENDDPLPGSDAVDAICRLWTLLPDDVRTSADGTGSGS